MIESIIFGLLAVAISVIFCIFRAKKATVFSLSLKTLASICFILSAVFAIINRGTNEIFLFILVGLIFGLIGDIILDLKVMYPQQSDSYFTFGTLSFVFGHIFYLASVCLFGIAALPEKILWCALASVGVAIVLTASVLLSSKIMKLNFGKHTFLVTVYSMFLTFMMAFSVSIAIFVPIFWIFAAGMIVFLLSDLVLSMQYFGGRNECVWIFVNHILYYIAQALIAISILYITVA